MIDTHAHLDFLDFDEDREEVISRFFENGPAVAKAMTGEGKAIINVGVDLERSRKSVEIAKKYENIYASVGIHPEYFNKAEKDLRFTIYDLREKINELKKLAKHKKVVAVGETGLDYFRETHNPQRDTQKEGFISQIKLAQELNLPVIVHCRNAFDDLYDIISKVRLFPSGKRVAGIPQSRTLFVLHCYSGEKKDTERFLEFPNIYFSFSGNITYPPRKSSHPSAPAGHLPSGRGGGSIEEIIKMIPLDKIMLDSDAPFLAPQEFRGKRNEPIFVEYIAKKIAEIKGISFEEVEQVTDENAERFFGV